MRKALILVLLIMVGSVWGDSILRQLDMLDSIQSWLYVSQIDWDNKTVKDSTVTINIPQTNTSKEWVYSIFWIDTIGWYADTSFEEYDPYYGIPGVHTLEFNYRTYIRWHPKIDTTYIGKLISDKREPIYDKRLLVKREPVK